MKHRGAITVFAAAFAVVLLGGLALAQVGGLRVSPAADTVETVETVGPLATVGGTAGSQTSTADPKEAPVGRLAVAGSGDTPEAPPTSAKPGDDGGDGPDATNPPDEQTNGEEGGDGEEPPDTTPPRLEILHPEDGQVFREKSIAFEGITEPGANVAAGRYQADINGDGGWRIVLVLSVGRNLAKFTATDPAGNTTTASVVVYFEEDKPEPPTREFSAHQKYGSSSATPPFDVFHGTAAAGTKVHIASDYGSKTVTANSDGNWEARVTFAEAPIGKAIRVVVESSEGGRKVFEFVNKGNDEGHHEFTASQKYGSCGEEIPYDVFYGRADSGERIWVESRYGSGVTEANADGHWEIRVEFAEAPPGEVFEVVIEAENGGRKVFKFVNTAGIEH